MERVIVLSLNIQRALEQEIVGQPRAVDALVRAVTIAHSDLSEREAPVGMFLFLGPSGTGKTHIVQSLARVLHGDTGRLVAVDCVQLGQQDDWQELGRWIAPHFRFAVPGYDESVRKMAPLSILLIEHLEAVRSEFTQGLVAAFETGRVALTEGLTGSLRDSLVVFTSRLCAREIFGEDRQEIGFSPTSSDAEESERERIFRVCCDHVEQAWGTDFLGHLDDLIIFHRLREQHLPLILQRFVSELNRRLAPVRVRVELESEVAHFLLERGGRFLKHGAWYLGKVFRRHVLFPMADLTSGGMLQRGSRILVRLVDGAPCMSVVDGGPAETQPDLEDAGGMEIPIVWDETAAAVRP
jgi:ATP-dependent Clp protease ATP-binding subunit ClpC